MLPAVYHYYVGTYYSAEPLADNGVAGYVLAPDALAEIASLLVGCPVTFEHAGIADAAHSLGDNATPGQVVVALNRSAAASNDHTRKPVAVIDDTYRNSAGSWRCTFAINASLFPRLCAMIDAGSLRGLSLSHFEPDTPLGTRVPLEVSLCKTPARPHCYLHPGAFRSPSELRLYKAFDCAPITPQLTMASTSNAEMKQPAAAAPDDINAALKGMTEAQRGLVSAALESMQKTIDSATQRATQMQEENDTLKSAQQVDKALLQSQIETFISQIGTEKTAQFGITADGCAEAFSSENPSRLRHQIDRMLMCCNTAMMQAKIQQQAGASAAVNVPAATATADVAQAAPLKRKAAPEPAASSAASFEPTEPNAATTLRNALAMF